MDVSNYKSVMGYKRYNIDIIVHTGALVNADYCECNYDQAYDIIVNGTKNILELAKFCNAKLLYPQSFLIFDSKEDGFIDEKTIPNPLSIYGKLKLKSENIVRKYHKNHLIIRMGGFFGGHSKDKNFVGKIIPHIRNLIENNIEYIEAGDRVWQPTYIYDIAMNSMHLLNIGKKGVYNMVSLGEASFYDVTKEIVKNLDIDKVISVRKISSEFFDNTEKANRPHRVVMLNSKLIRDNINYQRNWKDSLSEHLDCNYYKDMFLNLER